MATVINTFPDRRAELLGKGLGALVGSVIVARRKKKEEEERRKKLNQGLELLGRATRGEKAEFGPSITVGPTKKFKKAGPGKGEVTSQKLLPRPGRVPTGSDVAKPLVEAGVEDKFTLALAQGIDEEKAKSDKEKSQRVNLAAVLSLGGEGLTSEQLFDAISTALVVEEGLPFDVVRTLIGQVNELAGAGGEKLRAINIFGPKGPLGTLDVPESVHRLSQSAQDAYFKSRGFEGITTQPTADVPQEALTKQALQALVDRGVIDEVQMEKHLAGLIRVRGPDQVGRNTIIDLSDGSITVVGGGLLTPATLGQIDERILAINDALLLFKRADLSNVGIAKILKAEIGGIALQVPILGAIAEALGLNPEEIAKIQGDRSVFFAVLDPLVQSFSPTGSRNNRASKVQIELAKRMSNMVRFASTPGGAEMSRNQLVDVLSEIRNNLVAQRISGNSLPINVPRVDWFIDDNDKLQFKMLGE